MKANPASGVVPLSVTITTEDIRNENRKFAYRVMFGDETYSGNFIYGATLLKTYEKAGTYTVQLQATPTTCAPSASAGECENVPSRAVWSTVASTKVNAGGSIPTPTAAVSAKPTSGAAPLKVTFSLNANDSSSSSGIYYAIVFGDNDARGFPQVSSPSVSHTYTAAGTYTATVTRYTQCSSWECLGPVSTFGKVKITVTGGTTTTTPTSYEIEGVQMLASVIAAPYELITDLLGSLLYELGLY